MNVKLAKLEVKRAKKKARQLMVKSLTVNLEFKKMEVKLAELELKLAELELKLAELVEEEFEVPSREEEPTNKNKYKNKFGHPLNISHDLIYNKPMNGTYSSKKGIYKSLRFDLLSVPPSQIIDQIDTWEKNRKNLPNFNGTHFDFDCCFNDIKYKKIIGGMHLALCNILAGLSCHYIGIKKINDW